MKIRIIQVGTLALLLTAALAVEASQHKFAYSGKSILAVDDAVRARFEGFKKIQFIPGETALQSFIFNQQNVRPDRESLEDGHFDGSDISFSMQLDGLLRDLSDSGIYDLTRYINKTNASGQTALHSLVQYFVNRVRAQALRGPMFYNDDDEDFLKRMYGIVGWFKDNGANLQARNSAGFTPLASAMVNIAKRGTLYAPREAFENKEQYDEFKQTMFAELEPLADILLSNEAIISAEIHDALDRSFRVTKSGQAKKMKTGMFFNNMAYLDYLVAEAAKRPTFVVTLPTTDEFLAFLRDAKIKDFVMVVSSLVTSAKLHGAERILSDLCKILGSEKFLRLYQDKVAKREKCVTPHKEGEVCLIDEGITALDTFLAACSGKAVRMTIREGSAQRTHIPDDVANIMAGYLKDWDNEVQGAQPSESSSSDDQ